MRRAGGFTLIEVLVALAIVAIGMAAVLGTLSTSANTISYLRDKTFAQWVALNKIANLRLSGQMTHTGNSDGDTDYAGRKWHWRQEVNTTEIPGVVRIDVRVRPADVKGDDEHGWYTTVSGIPVTQLIDKAKLDAIVDRTRNGGAEIVKHLKTGSAYYAPSAGAVQMAEAIVNDQRRILPCAAWLDGEYGMKGLFLGVPCKLGRGGLQKVIEVELTADERAALAKSAEAVREPMRAVKL